MSPGKALDNDDDHTDDNVDDNHTDDNVDDNHTDDNVDDDHSDDNEDDERLLLLRLQASHHIPF